jgi:serine kinase of HPr protein (carbohydrate metabolism regulator)
MKISRVIEQLGLVIISDESGTETEVTGGYVSDLLSDVMGNAKEGQVWITLQNHKNIIAVASLKDIPVIILVKGLKPDAETLARSHEENVMILGTDMETFETAGMLYSLLQKA